MPMRTQCEELRVGRRGELGKPERVTRLERQPRHDGVRIEYRFGTGNTDRIEHDLVAARYREDDPHVVAVVFDVGRHRRPEESLAAVEQLETPYVGRDGADTQPVGLATDARERDADGQAEQGASRL